MSLMDVEYFTPKSRLQWSGMTCCHEHFVHERESCLQFNIATIGWHSFTLSPLFSFIPDLRYEMSTIKNYGLLTLIFFFIKLNLKVLLFPPRKRISVTMRNASSHSSPHRPSWMNVTPCWRHRGATLWWQSKQVFQRSLTSLRIQEPSVKVPRVNKVAH